MQSRKKKLDNGKWLREQINFHPQSHPPSHPYPYRPLVHFLYPQLLFIVNPQAQGFLERLPRWSSHRGRLHKDLHTGENQPASEKPLLKWKPFSRNLDWTTTTNSHPFFSTFIFSKLFPHGSPSKFGHTNWKSSSFFFFIHNFTAVLPPWWPFKICFPCLPGVWWEQCR